MTHGVAVYDAAGVETMRTPTVRGGVFIGAYTLPASGSGTLTFANCAAGSLRVLQYAGGTHTWSIGVNGSGQPVINYSAYTPAGSAFAAATGLMVFTVDPTIESHGLIANNLSGERVFDTTFAKPEFLGKFTLSANGSAAAIQNAGWCRQNYQSSLQSVGAGRTRIIFYDLLDTGAQDVYYAPTQYFLSPEQANYDCGVNVYYPTGASWAVPTAYVFAIDGLTAAGSGWGLQVFNGAGQLTFEASKPHMSIREIGGTYAFPPFSFPNYGFVPDTFSLPSLPSSPATFLAGFGVEKWIPTGPQSSIGERYEAAFRRSGSTLCTRIFFVATFLEDAALSGFNEYGTRGNIVMPFINGSAY